MIIFLYGPDTFRSRRLLREMKDKFIKDADQDGDSLDIVDGQSATISSLIWMELFWFRPPIPATKK